MGMSVFSFHISRSDVRFFQARLLPAILLTFALSLPLIVGAAGTVNKSGGGWRLAEVSSPYLRMHHDNPVEWYPWGEEALAKARAENKPLFISIGYFTCHWCHVMERESFRNPDIARLLNSGFVSIKVDREQRPDLDAAYMSFVVAMRGYGGWPMTVLATPDGTPFFGGTYFPPEDRDNFPGLAPLLRKARTLWDKDRQNVIDMSKQAVEQLKQTKVAGSPLSSLTNEPVEKARKEFRVQFDHYDGGFSFPPKFPQPAQLLFLLQDGEQQSVDMALYTLDRMAAGGIHDHLEGGFHRYATDAAWRVPHFEKMLYDQALIARAYVAAFRRTKNKKYADIARSTLDFTLSNMRHPQGGFYSALGADSPVSAKQPRLTEEGAYYVWDWKQLRDAIPDLTLRQWAIMRYGLKQDGNVANGSSDELVGKNILYVARNDEELAEQFGESLATVVRHVSAVNRQLLSARQVRPALPQDDKIVTAWNGYMITALAEAAQVLNEPRYRRAAEETSRFILDKLYDEKRNMLFRDWRDGKRGVRGFAEDYAALTEGLLALRDLDAAPVWLKAARKLTDAQIEIFWDVSAGGFYGTARDTELWIRDKSAADSVLPSPNAVAVGNLLKLARLTGDKGYAEKAVRTAMWQGGMLRETPDSMPYTLMHWPLLMAQAGNPGAGKSR